jgi:hypothetical protein
LRVQPATVGDQPVQRVSIQFTVGHRWVVVPPARLSDPPPDLLPGAGGWLESLAGRSPADRLRTLPEAATDVLGTPRQRLIALASLYSFSDGPQGLLSWARAQMGVADPLAHWSRDELLVAFGEFCRRRDVLLRELANRVCQKEGLDALEAALAALTPQLSQRLRAVLFRTS